MSNRFPHLTKVSITGVDDQTSISALKELTEEFPFVEWGVLYYPEREGQGRNPSHETRAMLYAKKLPLALHLCGTNAFEDLLSGKWNMEFAFAQRVQLNINARKTIFTPAQVFRVYEEMQCYYGNQVILQRQWRTEHFIPIATDASLHPIGYDARRYDILVDGSCGRGLKPDQWQRPANIPLDTFVGYAGGIDADNAEMVIQSLLGMEIGPFWIDMETGVRTDDKLDLKKVRRVLETAAFHISPGELS